MTPQISYDHRYGPPSSDILEKILLSQKEVEGMQKRDLRCPICGYRIQGVFADRTGHAEVKCRKCKFEGPLNLAYFRRQRNHHHFFHLNSKPKKIR